MRLVALAAILLAAPLNAATEHSGSIGGVPIIERLDVADIAPGSTERFWFRAGDTAIGGDWLVPVIVVKGAKPGPKLLVTAGIHGDELNGIDVIHRLVRGLVPADLAGTLVAVPGLNTPGLLQGTREFTPDDSRSSANLNRAMPGDEARGGVDHYAGRLWNRLLRPNADQAVDLHTQSRGTAYVLYAFASTPRARRMAELMAPDIIKLDTGDKGTVENELVRVGVPAITLELGRPEMFDETMVTRGLAGIRNLMREMQMLDGAVVEPKGVTTGNILTPVRAPRSGWAHLLAPLGSTVTQGQPIATLTDAFGRVTDTLLAPVAGRISSSFTDPRRPRDSTIVRIIHWSPAPECAQGC